MNLFAYVVARDYGFAPNPFGGTCTLATCKPEIRQRANVGDWIAGIASVNDCRTPSLVYMMRVDELLTYDAYWNDQRFTDKKPSMMGSVKQLFGDNIYHRDRRGNWIQADSHHSHPDGTPNAKNISNDTQSEGVLVSRKYAYWGSMAKEIPQQFLGLEGESLLIKRGYRRHFSAEFIGQFVSWFEGLEQQGYLATPYRWGYPRATWSKRQS
jgi:hypothetical protein